jgi:hypothetical protein
MKQSFIIVLLLLLFSTCSVDDQVEPSSITEDNDGFIKGSVILFDRFNNDLSSYDNIALEVVDVDSNTVNVQFDSNGNFWTDEFIKGITYLRIDKPGYVGVRSIRIENKVGLDSIPPILLFEDLDIAYVDFWIDYTDDSFLIFGRKIDFEASESILVGDYICLSTNPDVSSNNNMMIFDSGSLSNLKYINSSISIGSKMNLDHFLDNGFKVGDIIYAVDYAVTRKFKEEFYWQTQVFDIVDLKLHNPTNISSFILD